MATPILDQASIDLAYKLQDPVSTGSSNGTRLSANERFRYIIRGYRRLMRMITILYPDLMAKISHSFYNTASGTSSAAGVVTHVAYSEIYEIFCKEPSDEDYVRANFIVPEDFLKVWYEENSFFKPDLNTDQYYWTRRSNTTLLVMPAVTLNWVSSYRKDTAALVEAGGQGGSQDLEIGTEYLDLLLSLAAAEAYLDINQGDAVNAYRQDVNEQLALLATMSNKQESKDEIKET